jgi:hypothetical protein
MLVQLSPAELATHVRNLGIASMLFVVLLSVSQQLLVYLGYTISIFKQIVSGLLISLSLDIMQLPAPTASLKP